MYLGPDGTLTGASILGAGAKSCCEECSLPREEKKLRRKIVVSREPKGDNSPRQ